MLKDKILQLLILISGICLSQNSTYQFTHLSTLEGLSQSSAIAIHQDNLGQIWIGTRDGLNKYDGSKFTIYRTRANDSTSISNNDILFIKQDRNDYIWIGTYNGLNKYNPKTNTFQRYFHKEDSSSLINNTIWTINEMSNGVIWVGTSNGLSLYDEATDTFTNYLKGRDVDLVYSILESKSGEVYLGTNNGLLRSQSLNAFNFSEVKGTNALTIQDIVESESDTILLATKTRGVLRYNVRTNEVSKYISDATKTKLSNVRQLQFDDTGKLWIGTYDGILIVDKDKSITTLVSDISNSKGLSKNSIKCIFKDKKGSLWIGTYYGGVNIWDAANDNFRSITQQSKSSGLGYNVVSSIENYKETIFFGTEGGGISIMNRSDDSFNYLRQSEMPELKNDNIKSLFLSRNDMLWIGTFNSGIAIYNPESSAFENGFFSKELDRLLDDVGVYAIQQDSEGNFWIGTFGQGLLQYNNDSKMIKHFRFNEVKNSLSSDLIRVLEIDSKQNIWAGTERGLNRLSPSGDISTYFYNSKLEAGEDILSVFEDTDKTIWVGTKAKGLFKFENSEFIPVDLNVNETQVSSVHSILQDKEGDLWISTNQGLIRYNLDTRKSIIYNQKEGVVSNEFNDNASLNINDTEFYFGGPSGVTYFHLDKLRVNDYAPQTIITDLKINRKSIIAGDESLILNQSVTYTENLKLNYNQGNFTFNFAIPNYINSDNNRYKYRLIGLTDDWIETAENSASYTIQSSGHYTFEVKGANSDGIWNKNATKIEIQVLPAPWKSWWAFLIYGALLLGALYFLFRILKSRTQLQTELELEHLEVERAKTANEAKLEFFTNVSHEFRTPLTLILGPLHQILEDYKGSSKMYKKLKVVEGSANHLLHLINRLMDFRKLENNLFRLEAAEGNIVKFLKEIYLSFSEFANDGDYDYSFHSTDDDIRVFYDRYKLERVFYNLISNAFRYTPKQGKIVIRIIQNLDSISVQVEDSGVGIAQEYKDKIFERFFEISANNQPDNAYNKGTGIGLSIVKNIVNLHKGKITIHDNINSEGSIFVVNFPIGRAHLKDDQIISDFKFSDDISQYVNQLIEPAISDADDIKPVVSADKPTVLLVEDNKPLRTFMSNVLIMQYNILEAENGKMALRIAQKETPDLIISDVVMPVMVGTELCALIKNDIRTSHIPIILLTSRSALIYRLEGLESGADDYISKPFDIKEFKMRIKNLLDSTSRLKEKFKSEDPLKPNEVIVSSLDEKLYKKALKIVETNIDNEQFDIPYFCAELGVSRTMLFVKVKAWTNFTPNEFIQHFRMKRATQILEQGKYTISEVCYKVGFRNPKYFSKCFQKKFGLTPTQYANKFSSFD